MTIREIEKTGRLVRGLVDKGANEIQEITFGVSDVERRLDALRAKAMKDAARRAEVYVDAIGLKLGRALEIAPEPEAGVAAPSGLVARRVLAGAAGASDALPVESGARTLRTRVTVTWALSR